MVQVADAGGTRPVNPAAATISAAANTPAAPQAPAPAAAPTQPRMSSDSFEGIPETVTIKSGDTLGQLVAKYQVSYEKLKELNPEIFKDGPDAKGKKRAADGHWVYPGDTIRLRIATASTPTPAPETAQPSPNGRVVEAAKAAIDEAKILPANLANGRPISEQAVNQAKEMLKLIPTTDPAYRAYATKVANLEKDFKATYPPLPTTPASTDATADPQAQFESASEGFNQAAQSYYEAANLPAARRKQAQTSAREEAIRYFSSAYDASRGLTSADARTEARERLEMMEYTLTDMGVNSATLALLRGESTDSAPTPDAPTPEAPVAEPTFAQRDLNQDGYLSGNELDAKARAYDADGNQRVTREEWEMAQMAERETQWKAEFAQADANQDGWLSGSEASRFAAADANGDFEVTEQEYLAARRIEVMNGVFEQDYAARDKNQDGYLSGNELDPATRAFDVDRDGRVSRNEYMVAKQGAVQAPAGAVPQQPVPQPMPTAPTVTPMQAFEMASARFNDATTRNDVLGMTTAYQEAAQAIAYMPAGAERDTLAAQLEIMGYTLQQAYAASGAPVAAGGGVPGVTVQPLNPGVQVPVTPTVVPGQPGAVPGVVPGAQVPGYPQQPGVVMPQGYPQPGVVYPQPGMVVQGYPQQGYQAAVPQAAPAPTPEPPRQTYTQVWSSPDALAEAMGYNKPVPATQGNNMSAQGNNANGTPGSDAAQGSQNPAQPQVNEQAVREIDAFLQRASADAVRDMLANRPELLYDSLPRQKAAMLRLLVEGRTDAGDRAAIVSILDMAAKTEQVDYMLHELDTLYGGAGKGIKRMLEDLDKPTKAAALKAMFTPSLMENRAYDQAAFDAVVGAMTKDDIKILMEAMGYGVSSPWMKVFSPQARQMMIDKLNSGFNLFGLFGGAEKQMAAALQNAATAYAPQVQPPAQPQQPAPQQPQAQQPAPQQPAPQQGQPTQG